MKHPQTYRLLFWGAFLVLVSLFETGSAWAAKKAATTGVPGVDKLPAARRLHEEPSDTTDSKKPSSKKSKTKKKEETGITSSTNPTDTLQEEEKEKLDLPLIRNLSVQKDASKPYSVLLEWEVSPANNTVIYVARYVRPLVSRGLLFDADLASLRPLSARTSRFLDYNVPDGTYYYAVVTAYEMSAPSRLVLKPGINYTTEPMVIYRKPIEPQVVKNTDLYQVRGLYAVNTKDSVVLSWTPAKATNILYNIYKSYQPLVESADLEFAQKLSVVGEETLKYTDTSPVENRKTWYAVTATDRRSAQEHRGLVANQNVVRNVFSKVKVDDDRLSLLPSSLTAFLVDGRTVKLLWSDPEKSVPELAIFRSKRPITSVSALRQATHVGSVAYGVREFRDSALAPGNYFYAVLPKKDRRKLIGIFVAGRSFTSFGIRVYPGKTTKPSPNNTTKRPENKQPEKKKEETKKIASAPVLRYLRAKAVQKDAILIKWKLKRKGSSEDEDDAADKISFLLYRSTEPVRNMDDLEEKAEFVEELDGYTYQYQDSSLAPGTYYYALVIDYDGNLQETLRAGRNYLRRPVRLGGKIPKTVETKKETVKIIKVEKIKKPQDSTWTLGRLNRILARTYHRKRYGAAIRQIAPFIYSKHVRSSVQSRALFYTGLSYYGLRRYRAALEYFVDDRVRTFYPERARFWYNRCIEKTGRSSK